ncbi:MAG: hypothetical protein EVG15_10335 [Candidatus Acididesulfobacter diazotrophicus]|uniref:DUF6311 domain-containing protein n=1 Tax=Candidatus Acididesulfobacter diazotrophicus TaxID=2597226 RepID=A0A519BK19_9DELT|nr:MAG: hypothetical protein EVG15_10335 [Candidatus Acididesulfobacter diazotrophicus]
MLKDKAQRLKVLIFDKIKLPKLPLLAFIIYLAVSILYFGLPILSHFNSELAASGTRDTAMFVWFLYWWPYAIIHGINPFISHYIWAPQGSPLTFTTSVPAAAILMAPVTLLIGPMASYNIIALLSPALAALFAYLVCKELTKKFLPSLFGGYIFGFSSFMLGEMLGGHLMLILAFPIPLAVYLSIRRIKNSISTKWFIVNFTILLVLLFGFSLELFATAAFFGAITCLIALLIYGNQGSQERGKLFSLFKNILISYFLAIIVISPYLYYMIKYFGVYPSVPNSPAFFSSDLLNYFFPTPITRLGGIIFTPLTKKFTGNYAEEGAYLGIPLLLIMSIVIIKFWKEKLIKLIAAVTIIVIICSFGPRLHIAGVYTIWMPWSLVLRLPLLSAALPIRFPMYVSLGAAILLAYWLTKSSWNVYGKYLAALIAIGFLIPNLSAGVAGAWIGKFYTPKFFKQGMYKKYIKQNENIIILPYMGEGYSMLYQARTNMYFRMAEGNAMGGVIPNYLLGNPATPILYNGTTAVGYEFNLVKFFRKEKVKAVITAKGSRKKWQKILKPLNFREINAGGVDIYYVPPKLKKLEEAMKIKMLRHGYFVFQSYRSAAVKYYDKYKTFSGLYPLHLEQIGLLPKSLGGFNRHSPKYNWTKNGFWIGRLGNSYAIGYFPAYYNLTKYLYKKFSKSIKKMYFPYPKLFNSSNNYNKYLQGQVLIQFKR